MSLKSKTERAFKALFIDAALPLQVLTSQENDATTIAAARVIIQARGIGLVSPKSGTQRYQVAIHIERVADYAVDDPISPEAAHAANVTAVRQILDDNATPLAQRLSAFAGADGVGDFTCFFIIPRGDFESEPDKQARVFRDSLAYQATVAQSIST